MPGQGSFPAMVVWVGPQSPDCGSRTRPGFWVLSILWTHPTVPARVETGQRWCVLCPRQPRQICPWRVWEVSPGLESLGK